MSTYTKVFYKDIPLPPLRGTGQNLENHSSVSNNVTVPQFLLSAGSLSVRNDVILCHRMMTSYVHVFTVQKAKC